MAHAIVDDRHGPRAASLGRRPSGRFAGRVALAPRPLPAGGLILVGAFAAAAQGVATEPLAFAIPDMANCLTTGGAAKARRVADRLERRFIAPGPGTKRGVKKDSCCVTTRRHNLGVLGYLRRGLGALAARVLRLCVLSFDYGIPTAFGLALRRLPAAEQPPAFGNLAVTLVPTPRPVLASAAFAQADPRPRSSRTGATSAVWLIMMAAHGSVISQGTARGERCYRSPRALINTGQQTARCQSTGALRKQTGKETARDRRGQQDEKRQANGGRQSTRAVQEPDGEGNTLRKPQPRRR